MAHQSKGAALTKRNELVLVVAFALASGEVFLVYRNFRTPLLGPEVSAIPFFSGFVTVCAALAACLAMLFAYLAFQKRIESDRHLLLALACSIAGPAISLVGGKMLGHPLASLPGAILAAVGCACFLPAIVKRVVEAGVRCSVRCSVTCCFALLVVAPLSMLVPIEAFTVLVAALSLGIFACLRSLGPDQEDFRRPQEKRQKLPRVLMLTIVIVSMMEGVMAVSAEIHMPADDKIVVFSLAFVAAAILCVVELLHSRVSFNKALYRLCIPLVAIGLSLLVFDNALALNMGTFFVLVGRQLFGATILALVVFLSRYHASDHYLLALGVFIGATTGNLTGLILYQLPWPHSFGHLISPALLVVLLVGSLVTAIYLTNENNLRSRWGMLAVDDMQETPGLTLDQSCEALGERQNLTQREIDVVKHVVRGRDRQAIAERLFISEGTVKVHMRNIYQKLGIHSKQELITLVEQTGETFQS